MRILAILALACLALSAVAQETTTPNGVSKPPGLVLPAKPDETWSCADRFDSPRKELVRLTAYREFAFGVVVVSGISQFAQYQVQGFNRRWDFGALKESGSLPFAFLIEPNGDGAYYDFSGAAEAKADQLYKCKQVSN